MPVELPIKYVLYVVAPLALPNIDIRFLVVGGYSAKNHYESKYLV
jgi:hypothetical protein